MKISLSDMSGFDGLGSEWDQHKLRYIFLHNHWLDLFKTNLERNSYLARRITDVIYLNKNGERLNNDSDFSVATQDIAKVVIQLNHIELHYTPANAAENKPPSLTASNLQLNPYTDGKKNEGGQALRERVSAALGLVQTAHALGWKAITYPDDLDAIDKMAIQLACKAADIKAPDGDITIPRIATLANLEDPEKSLQNSMTRMVVDIFSDKPPPSFDIEPNTYPPAVKADNDDEWGALDNFEPAQPRPAA